MHWLLTGSLSVEKLTIAIADLPLSLEGTKLVQLSDLHYDGLRLSEQMLASAIALANEAEPDLIVLTGDYVTDDPTPIHQLILRLKHLQSNCGIYAVLGNHDNDHPNARAEITAALNSIDIHVLWNQIAYPLGTELPIVGFADYWSKEFSIKSVMKQLNNKTPRIVLSHNPDAAKPLKKWRVDLQLSGHTHGGQFTIPGMGPAITVYKDFCNSLPKKMRRWVPFMQKDCAKVVRHWEWAQGYHLVGKNQLYVNRGLGTYLPGRFLCPPEVTVITLVSQSVKPV